MPHVRGVDLARQIAAHALTVGRVLALLGQVASGLDALHRCGLLHLDVKPANVLVGSGAGSAPRCVDARGRGTVGAGVPGRPGMCRFWAERSSGAGHGSAGRRVGRLPAGPCRSGWCWLGRVGRCGRERWSGRCRRMRVDRDGDGGIGWADCRPDRRSESAGHAGRDAVADDFVGSPRYASPEHLRGRSPAAADVYSLTCVLFACLAGRPPYVGDLPTVVSGHLAGRVPSLAALTALPRQLDAGDPARPAPRSAGSVPHGRRTDRLGRRGAASTASIGSPGRWCRGYGWVRPEAFGLRAALSGRGW